jgi:tRNA wybutosine-synthesizing protein 1
MDPDTKRRLEKQRYRIVGNNGAVKTCHWLKEKLLRGRACYKEKFYGISSHRCLQMTPTVNQCNENCLFCWRVQNFSETQMEKGDDPVTLLQEAIEAHRKLITGLKGDPRVKPEMWEEAWNPNQVAISLSGEPTMYPELGEFIAECKRRNMTTFLVTNGTLPKVLEHLDPLPTQLYVTVAAPNEGIFKKLCAPIVPNAWKNLNETLSLLPSLDVRTVIRHTLVNEWNLGFEDEYALLDRLADPLFIEPKGYVFVGASRLRMSITNMPSHELIREFTRKLSEELGYSFVNEQEASRVTLLSRETAPSSIM